MFLKISHEKINILVKIIYLTIEFVQTSSKVNIHRISAHTCVHVFTGVLFMNFPRETHCCNACCLKKKLVPTYKIQQRRLTTILPRRRIRL